MLILGCILQDCAGARRRAPAQVLQRHKIRFALLLSMALTPFSHTLRPIFCLSHNCRHSSRVPKTVCVPGDGREGHSLHGGHEVSKTAGRTHPVLEIRAVQKQQTYVTVVKLKVSPNQGAADSMRNVEDEEAEASLADKTEVRL